MDAIGKLVGGFSRNSHLGYPIVELSTSQYKNKRYGGYTSVPVFVTVGYAAPKGGSDARVIEHKAGADIDVIESDEPVRVDRGDMDDEIPF
jgi:hypothetical protein